MPDTTPMEFADNQKSLIVRTIQKLMIANGITYIRLDTDVNATSYQGSGLPEPYKRNEVTFITPVTSTSEWVCVACGAGAKEPALTITSEEKQVLNQAGINVLEKAPDGSLTHPYLFGPASTEPVITKKMIDDMTTPSWPELKEYIASQVYVNNALNAPYLHDPQELTAKFLEVDKRLTVLESSIAVLSENYIDLSNRVIG